MIEICSQNKCNGCSACFNVCPKQCIKMTPDNEGFLRPVINSELCVDCGMCHRVCPINNPINDDKTEPATYAARINEVSIKMESSSGGVFTAIATSVIKSGGVVFGAAFAEDFSVKHIAVEDMESLGRLRGSKYVQSEIGNTYKRARDFLDAGRSVLFTGTPCQIGGLYAFLGKKYDNLLTQDFICHGVPSPDVWNKYIKYREEKAASKTRRTFFRHKKYGWKNYSVLFEFSNNTEYIQILSKDLYMRAFIANFDLRPSCYQCSFKQIHRVADITLADFWGIDNSLPEWNNDTGVSLVLVHTEIGRKVLEACVDSMEMRQVDFACAVAANPSLTQSVKEPALRRVFMRDLHRLPFPHLHEKYLGNSLISKFRRKAAQLIGKR